METVNITTPETGGSSSGGDIFAKGMLFTFTGFLGILFIWSLVAPVSLAFIGFSVTKNSRVALALGRNHTDVYTALGSQYFGGGQSYNVPLAKSYFEEAVRRDGENYVAEYQLARIAFIEGDLELSKTHLKKSTSLAPEFARNYYMQGLIYGFAKEYETAEVGFKEFISRAPDVWAGYVDLSWIYFAQGKFHEGLALLEPVAEQFAQVPWFENAYGLFLMHNYRYPEAFEHLTAARDALVAMTEREWGIAYPGNDPTHYAQGYAQMQLSIEKNIELVQKIMKDITPE